MVDILLMSQDEIRSMSGQILVTYKLKKGK